MYGVTQGVYYCNNGRLDNINKSIYNRNIPTGTMQTAFSPRPVDTKYVVYPAYDCRTPAQEPHIQHANFKPSQQFNPGTSAPYSGYATNVNDESILRDIVTPNQKWCAQTRYIPSSKSDLYEVNVPEQQNIQNHPMLFERENFAPFNPNACNLGGQVFNNHTREQLLNLKR